MKSEELLKKGLQELNIKYSQEQIHAFIIYLSELKKWNKTYNLTALRNDNDIIVKHFLDSLLYIRALPENISRLADAGSGAGFPGIPLKIINPELDITLIEPSRKKAAFLRHIIRQLRLKDINVIEERLENLEAEYEHSYEILVSRATFSINDFLKMACPYIKIDGKLILSKGPKISEELKDLNKSPDSANAVQKTLEVQLPFEKAQRNLVVLNCKPLAP